MQAYVAPMSTLTVTAKGQATLKKAVPAFKGRRLGGETFVSFDRQAVRLVQAGGVSTRLLA